MAIPINNVMTIRLTRKRHVRRWPVGSGIPAEDRILHSTQYVTVLAPRTEPHCASGSRQYGLSLAELMRASKTGTKHRAPGRCIVARISRPAGKTPRSDFKALEDMSDNLARGCPVGQSKHCKESRIERGLPYLCLSCS